MNTPEPVSTAGHEGDFIRLWRQGRRRSWIVGAALIVAGPLVGLSLVVMYLVADVENAVGFLGATGICTALATAFGVWAGIREIRIGHRRYIGISASSLTICDGAGPSTTIPYGAVLYAEFGVEAIVIGLTDGRIVDIGREFLSSDSERGECLAEVQRLRTTARTR